MIGTFDSEEENNRFNEYLKNREAAGKSHTEQIKCPECGKIQNATVLHTCPWFSYVHHCEQCKYIIMESEWNKQ